MSSVMPARRRAEKFNAWLEGTTPEALNDARILEVVSALRGAEAPELRADFAADLRDRLMAEADTVLVRTERNLTVPGSLAPTQRRQHRRLAVAVSALAVVGATTSVSMASQNALPGDALYPIKRALENAQTGMASGDAKTQEMLSNATSRLNEATELASKAESSAVVAATLDDFAAQANDAAEQALASNDPTQITQLRAFTAESMHELELLDSVVPSQVRAAVAAAAHLLTDIDQRALVACPTCGGAVIDLPKIFLASASATKTGIGVLAPTAGTGTLGDGTKDGGLAVPSILPEAHPDGSTTSTDGTSQPEASDPQLIPSGDSQASDDPATALNELLTGGNKDSNTSNPLEPITSPLVDAIDKTVTDALDALTP